MSTVGFIGLGAMGGRMAMRLLDAGHQLYGTNRTPARAQDLVARGMVWMETPREVAAAADITFSMVTDDAALEAITRGADGLLAGLAPGKVYVDMSTVSPQASRAVSAQVSERGAEMLDAPVSGSIPQVESGTLTIMVGGTLDAFNIAAPALAALGTATRVGSHGQGLVLKLAINISLGMQVLAFSEGLVLAERDGIDPALAAQVMSTSPIGSPMLKARLPLIMDLPEGAWFDISMLHKDIRLAREAGERQGTVLPSAAVADWVLTASEQLGYAHRDIAGLHEALQQIADAPVA